jgi:hypothetical protein
MQHKTLTAQFSAVFPCMISCGIDCHHVHFIKHVKNSHPIHVCNNTQNMFLSEPIYIYVYILTSH